MDGEISNSKNVGEYLIERLVDNGINHIFGVPGDFVLGFYNQLSNSKVKVINMSDEQGAGFAADAYSRIKGLGAVCVTYCVGGFKVVNTTAEAFAERSPLVVISGSPGIKERIKDPMLHHRVKDFDTQLKVFQQITIASVVLDDPVSATQKIDDTIGSALYYKGPVYIEIPRDIVSRHIILHNTTTNRNTPDLEKNRKNLNELDTAIVEIIQMINSSNKPVILAGIEVHRYGLQNELLSFVEKSNIPVASTILGKSIVSELHPLYIGIYEGSMGDNSVRNYVESSDCLILLGAFMTDLNLGGFTSQIDKEKSINISSHETITKNNNYKNVTLSNILKRLASTESIKRHDGVVEVVRHHYANPTQFSPLKGKKISIKRLFECINSFLSDNTIVVADIGEALFGSTDLVLHRRTSFLSPAYYASMGFAVPASIGAQLAKPNCRPIVIVGDGAFQMTGIELSTALRFNLNPIVIVLNNHGYGTERSILDGPFNDIQNWRYDMIPQLVGGGKGFTIDTEEHLHDALHYSIVNTSSFCILDVHLDPYDKSPALKRLTEVLSKKAV